MLDLDLAQNLFADLTGVSGLIFDQHNQILFKTASGRLIGMEHNQQELLAYVAIPVDYDSSIIFLRACKQAYYSQTDIMPVQPAIRQEPEQNYLLALTRLNQEQLSESRLNKTYEFLSDWLTNLQQQ